MAAKNVDRYVINKQVLDNMTSCCICTEVFEDLKALPCIHTFCMKCLQETGLKTNKGPGDEIPCPVCRRMFKIPTEGFLGLSNKNFIEDLIQVTNVSDLPACSRTVCDACLDEPSKVFGDEPSKEIPVADAYCVQCNQNFCEECCKQHRKLKLTKNHKLVEISEYGGGQNVMTDSAPSICELHERNNLNIYCADCKTVVCDECFIDDHNNHIDMEKQVNKALRDELDKETANYNSCTEELKKELDENKTTNSTLQAKYDRLKQELVAIKMTNNSLQADIDQLRQDLDKEKLIRDSLQTDRGKLKQKLDKEKIAKTSRQTDREKLKQELDPKKFAKTSLHANKDKLKQYLDEEKFATNSLNASKNELVEEGNMNKTTLETLEEKVEKLEEELKTLKIDSENKILDLEEKLEQEKNEKEQFRIVHTEEKQQRLFDKLRRGEGPVLVEKIRTKASQNDEWYHDLTLTILDEELFVASEKRSRIEVYDSTKLKFSRQWNLNGLIDPKDIVSCDGNKCLYVMDYKGDGQSKEILRVDRNGKLIKKWSTGDSYGWGLSVTNELNVILTVFDKNKLIEYSSDGKLIREINLSSGTRICEPWHAVKLSNGDFLVSHGCTPDQLHRLCLVNADGKLKKSFGDICQYDLRETLSQTSYLAVHQNGFVLVSDRCNSSVMLFDSNLKFKGVILSHENHSLNNPGKILLDESNGRLFVVDKNTRLFWMSGQRVKRKDNVQILIFDF